MGQAVRVGIVGLGQRGLQHLKAVWALQEEGAAQVVALGDAFEENLVEAKLQQYVPGFKMGTIGTSTAFDALFDQTKPDAIYFCIPPGFHNGELVRAAREGTHIFAEKPMSLFVDEAIQMDREIRKAGVVSAAGFQRRFEPHSEVIHRFLQDKRPVMVTMASEGSLESHSVKHTRTEQMGGPRDQVWAKNRAWSGGTIVEAGIHQTDLMRYWFGDIQWVQATYVPRDAQDIEDGGDNPYAYAVTYGFKNGAVGNLLMSRLRRVYRSDGYQIVMWDHGHLKAEAGEVAAYYYEGPYPPDKRPSSEQIRHVLPVPERRDITLMITRRFIEAVSTGDESGILSTFSSSMNSLAAVLAANESHQRGGERVDLDEFLTADAYAAARRRPE